MHVVAPERYQSKPIRRKVWRFFAVPLAITLTVGATNFARPLPAATATLTVQTPATTTPQLDWPAYGQQAVAASGYGVLASNGAQTPLATASIAKVILALCVLQKHPMNMGDAGQTYTMDAVDIANYQQQIAQDGSSLPVTLGEKLTEYQMLQALMIPSANNIADSLVKKVWGGQTAYAEYANNYLLQSGLVHTTIGSDASGYSASTASTATDLTQLGLLALKSPVLMDIAGQKSATFPITGTLQNYNAVLGVNSINGLKTGNNEENPGALLFTGTAAVGGQEILLSGTVMGAGNLATALQDSTELIASLQQGFEKVTLSKTGGSVGTLHTAWGTSSPIVTATSLELVRWKATPLTEKHTVHTDVRSGEIGSMQVAAGQAKTISTLKLQHAVPGPSFWWRLTRH